MFTLNNENEYPQNFRLHGVDAQYRDMASISHGHLLYTCSLVFKLFE